MRRKRMVLWIAVVAFCVGPMTAGGASSSGNDGGGGAKTGSGRGATDAQSMRGAQAVLKAAADRAGQTESEAKAPGEVDSLKTALKRYKQRRVTMSPRQAGRRWLALFDRYVGSPSPAASRAAASFQQNRFEQGGAFGALVEVLPGPGAWPTMAKALARRDTPEAPGPAMRAAGLKLFVHFLVGDADAMAADLKSLLARSRKLPSWRRQNAVRGLGKLAGVIGHKDQDPRAVADVVETRIRAAQGGQRMYSFDVPDLVTLVGEDKAKALLGRIVVLPVARLQFEPGDRTKALARQVTMEHVDQLARPRWRMVDSIKAVDLFEALRGRFLTPAKPDSPDRREAAPDHGEAGDEGDDAAGAPAGPAAGNEGGGLAAMARMLGFASPSRSSAVPEMNHRELTTARTYYALGLIARGRADDAARQLHRLSAGARGSVSLPYDALGQLDRAGYTNQVYRVVDKLLAEDPTLPLWTLYASLAVRSGHAPAMLARTEQASRAKGLSKSRRRVIRQNLMVAQLAAQRDDQALAKAVGTLKELIASAPAAGDRSSAPGPSRLDLALKLATIGDLVGRGKWYQEGMGRVESALRSAGEQNRWAVRRAVNKAAALMTRRGEYRRAEKLLGAALTRQLRARAKRARGGPGAWTAMDQDTPEALLRLAGVYHAAGRDRDVLALLRDAPYWAKGDLADLYTKRVSERQTLGSVAAWALIARGHEAKAAKIAAALIDHQPASDRGYQLLVRIRGQKAMPYLDKAFERDPFEERPLIWKARLQLAAGRAAKAEATIRRAILIDPSDGEEGRGDRMRAYGVLADVLRARGKGRKAAFFDRVVKSIRESEDADRFHAAGMTARAVAMYNRALGEFADAYCIQSRLAIQLASLGRMDEAAAHYRRAYELMPSSFGRVESHCFGCEGVFRSPLAQSIAEDVFLRLVRAKPRNPQVRYLLGYLRQAQHRFAPAAKDYRRAVKLDPDYLNAWSRLSGLADHVHIPVNRRDHAILSVLRLDPLQRHTHADLSEVFHAKALWKTVAAAQSSFIAPPEHLLTLVAAQQRIQKRKKAMAAAGAPGRGMEDAFARQRMWWAREGVGTPGEVLARHTVTRALGPVMRPGRGF